MGHLKIKWFMRLGHSLHEADALRSHGERLFGIGARYIIGSTIAGRAITLIKAMLRGIGTPHMPLAEMCSAIALTLQQFCNCCFLQRHFC